MICKEVEQDLALAAAGCLEPGRQLQVEDHCRQCAECAARLQQFQLVASAHSSVAKELNRRTWRCPRATVRLTLSAAVGDGFAFRLVRRWLLPLGAVTALGIVLVLRHDPVPPPDAEQKPPAVPPLARAAVDLPSLAAYRNAWKERGDASLDALLSRHELHLLPHTPDLDLRRTGHEL